MISQAPAVKGQWLFALGVQTRTMLLVGAKLEANTQSAIERRLGFGQFLALNSVPNTGSLQL